MNGLSIRRQRASFICLLDIIGAIVIFSLLFYLRLGEFPSNATFDLSLITITFVAVLFLGGTYFRERSTIAPNLPIRTFFTCLTGGLVCVLWVYLLGPSQFNKYFGRGILPTGTLLFGVYATFNRFIFNRIYHRQEINTNLLYLGYSNTTNSFLNELANHSEIRSVHFATDRKISHPQHKELTTIGADYQEILNQKWQGVIIDPSHHSDSEETKKLINLRLSGTPVLTLADYYEKYWFMVPVDQIGDDWFLRSQGFSMLARPVSLRIKRFIDLMLATLLLIITSPITMLCAASIKLTSPGNILFKQERVGEYGKTFIIYKLRTMQSNAEQDGAKWASENDVRITKVGSFLRKSRLDELPQCWNVLKGEMSFIGPRPEQLEFTKELEQAIPYYNLRHTVKPGISGWAQVIFPYGASKEDALRKLQYELYYIKNQSLMFDFNIMLRTVLTVFQRSGR